MKNNSVLYLMTVLIVMAVVATFLLAFKVIVNFGNFFPEARDEWGMLGDFFGGMLNPFFALLGLIMLLVTLYQNQKELYYSRMELKSSNEALKSQANIAAKQRFEDTFLSLLKLHNDKIEFLTKGGMDSSLEGLNNSIIGCGSYRTSIGFNINCENTIENAAKDIEMASGEQFGVYFKLLTSILEFIDDEVSQDEFYINLFKCHMPKNIIPLLLIYSSSDTNTALRLRPLVKRYTLLEGYSLDLKDSLNVKLINDAMNVYCEADFGESRDKYIRFRNNANKLLSNVKKYDPWEFAKNNSEEQKEPSHFEFFPSPKET